MPQKPPHSGFSWHDYLEKNWNALYPALVRYAIHLLTRWLGKGSRAVKHDAEDLVQQAIDRVLRSNPVVDNFRPYLNRIIRNGAIDLCRKRSRRKKVIASDPVIASEGDASSSIDRAMSPDASPDAMYLVKEANRIVLEDIDRLPPHFKAALWKKEIEGHSYEEIAEALRLPIGTVRVHVSRAKEQVRAFRAERREQEKRLTELRAERRQPEKPPRKGHPPFQNTSEEMPWLDPQLHQWRSP